MTNKYLEKSTLSYSEERDTLGDLNQDSSKSMIKKLRSLKCVPESTGETWVLFYEETIDNKTILPYRLLSEKNKQDNAISGVD